MYQIYETIKNKESIYMDIWDKCDSIVYCDDLTKCGYIIIEFASEALKDKNRTKLVKRFYSQLISFAFVDYAFDMSKTNYMIYDNRAAIRAYLGLTLPNQSSPVKSLNALIKCGYELNQRFSYPVGSIIQKETVVSVMNYLDEKLGVIKKG